MKENEKIENPEAFPLISGTTIFARGMTLRDYFAGQVVAGITANPEVYKNGIFIEGNKRSIHEAAFEIADAMLKERNENPGE